MLTEQATDCFGNKARICEILNLTSGRPSQWGPVVHENSAPKLAHYSNGKLKYDPEFYIKLKKNPNYWKKALRAYRADASGNAA